MKYSLDCFLILTLYCTWTIAREVPSPPYIVKQPPTDEVLFQVESSGENDKPFYIECEAIGEPAPKYYWIKNGKPFAWQTYDDRISQQMGRGTLSITKPSDVDLGQYQCFAENQYGIATSNSVFMRKAELNSFKATQPLTLTGNEGEPFKLTCQPPDGWPKPIVHWIFLYTNGGFKTINSSRMTLDPEGNLWFSNLTKADVTDNFMYACAATSPTKYEYKYGNRVLLNVVSSGVSASQNKHEPVLQYVTRKNEVAYRGKRAELFCIFGGTPLPQTVWKKGGKLVQSSDRITQGNYGKSLIIKVVDFDDEGSYTCEVSNGVGEAKSYSISLKVLAVPYFIKEPERVNAAEDETIEFSCVAGGVPEPQIKWIHNGKPIEEALHNPRRKVFNNKIIIEGLQKNDTGNYGCNATNSLGYVYKDVYVNVLALAPEIIEAPRDTQAVDNQNVTMICKVLGAPKPNVKWIQNGRELTGGKYDVQSNGDLIIDKVQFDDRGNYTCYAENKLGNTSAIAKLDIKSHTYITDGPEDYEVEARTPATFRCNAVADESLDLEIIWLKNDQPIDFEGEPRFVKSSDYSLTITKTHELDSGTYTCLARTELDEASAKAQLTVQDVPNKPKMFGVTCRSKDATISWTSMGDNRAPISYYIIQYNTSFIPEEWKDFNQVPSADTTYNVPLEPWANYTFRVIAVNKIGQSKPSSHSDVCTTPPEVPHKNPDNVKGEGDQPDNLVISWTPMPQIEHGAPGFKYRVGYKRAIDGVNYEYVEILDYKQNKYVVPNQLSYQQYKIIVHAVNELGEANVAPQEVIGYSGESKPEKAPTNFTLLAIQGPTTALLSWDPVPLESVRGHFKGYKIKTWSDTSSITKEIQVQGGNSKALVSNFDPYTKNYAVVYVFNEKYNGPPSDTLSFDTPEGKPGEMQGFEAYPLGSTGFLLKWEKPDKPNGILTGYNIYWSKVDPFMKVDEPNPRKPQIMDPNLKRAKLGNLLPGTKYRLYIAATTKAGESKRYFIERTTRAAGKIKPSKPTFEYQIIKPGPPTTVRIHWLPAEDGKGGTSFFVKYRKRGESSFEQSRLEENDDWTDVAGLDDSSVYEFIVTAFDGKSSAHMTDSDVQEISTYDIDGPIIRAKENVATAGWFIGMMLAIAFLLLVLIIVCIIKRNRGGKYAVHEREQANGRHDYPDEGGFHEYSQPLDNKSHGRTSMNSDSKVGPESDTDSMAEYGDGDTGRFTEDGSFIGQYVPSNMKQLGLSSTMQGTNNNAMGTYV
ncbi:neuroglian isoform X1 [Diabrotica virgifera virgifera]|uniref:Neuroglian n=2 Tax=Diabrotica virgifera virgifera TaxID=50390 RepID=A0ABM5LA89_DIAVI|nr:neuroglian isoform X1 [Diabrotica virgifera virgifera]XP_050519352.1 neuroglian isoform X1 [Diabrotica virgifera virgifera]